MTPLVAAKLARERQNFDGTIEVVEDNGSSIVTLVTPPADEPPAKEDGSDWARQTQPFLMLIDEARPYPKFIQQVNTH